jgi:hypothetical protein
MKTDATIDSALKRSQENCESPSMTIAFLSFPAVTLCLLARMIAGNC